MDYRDWDLARWVREPALVWARCSMARARGEARCWQARDSPGFTSAGNCPLQSKYKQK